MRYRYLGDTGVQVSALCMGTMTFGREADKATSSALFKRCRNAGINFFDCANVYASGDSERILGGLIAGCRDEVIITSKVFGQTGPDRNARGNSRRNIAAAVEASLRRLNTDYLDVYFLHGFDAYTPLEETLRALDDLVSQGKALYLGASNFTAWQVMKALGISAKDGWSKFKVIQPMYNLVKRQAEAEILPMAQAERLGVISYSPLGGGLLTGKYKPDAPPVGRIAENQNYAKRYGDEWMHQVALEFADLAGAHGLKPAALAVAWVAVHPGITAPIIGARSLEQLEESLGALTVPMTSELYAEVARLTPHPPPPTDRTEETHPPVRLQPW
ncbi:MAG: aldo/keto reductase [Chloroflexi bacterium]|nr:aldo/keto reductase [Chloroflexota bacterium]